MMNKPRSLLTVATCCLVAISSPAFSQYGYTPPQACMDAAIDNANYMIQTGSNEPVEDWVVAYINTYCGPSPSYKEENPDYIDQLQAFVTNYCEANYSQCHFEN